MGKKHSKIQIRKQKEIESLLACQKALDKAKNEQKRTDLGTVKRKDHRVLARYLALSRTDSRAIRDVEEFEAKSYNLGRQVQSLADHLFARYPTPKFLYRAILSRPGQELLFDIPDNDEESRREAGKRRYVRWFLTAAQGGSLAKELAGILNKREVHWFLQAPAANSIQRNLFWAKLAAAGLPMDACQFLTDQFGAKHLQSRLGTRRDDLVRFYATEWPKMRRADRQEIADFVRNMFYDPGFSFKGRTYGSMQKLCREWHNSLYSTKVKEFKSWPQSFEPWTHEKREHCVRAVELTNSRALADEGRHQRHCVYSYESNCIRGWSRIVSLRWVVPASPLEVLNRLTIEVDPSSRTVSQIRGRSNRKADELEMKIVRLWAGAHGLRVETWANE
jgi:hypothetical protein